MPKGRAPKGYTCRTCGETLPTFPALGAHAQKHTPDERAAAQGFTGSPAAPRVARHRIEETLGGGSTATAGLTDARERPAAGPSPSDPPPTPEPGTDVSRETRPRPSRATVAAPSIRISPEQRAASTADAIRDAMPLSTVADMLVALSRAISDLDGAGDAGVLSQIQATQVASLLYDSTIDLVLARFGGDVSKFKAGLAIVIILLSKGKVHAQAVAARVTERRMVAQAARDAAVLTGATGAGEFSPQPGPPQTLEAMAQAARERQAAMIANLPG